MMGSMAVKVVGCFENAAGGAGARDCSDTAGAAAEAEAEAEIEAGALSSA